MATIGRAEEADVALDVEQRRRRIDGGQRRRIAGLDREQRARRRCSVGAPRARLRPRSRGQMRIALPRRRAATARAAPRAPARAPPKWLMSSRKVTGPTLSLRIRRRQASRWACVERRLRQRAASARQVSVRGLRPGRRSCAPRRQADAGCWRGACEDQKRDEQDEQQSRPGRSPVVEHDGTRVAATSAASEE